MRRTSKRTVSLIAATQSQPPITQRYLLVAQTIEPKGVRSYYLRTSAQLQKQNWQVELEKQSQR